MNLNWKFHSQLLRFYLIRINSIRLIKKPLFKFNNCFKRAKSVFIWFIIGNVKKLFSFFLLSSSSFDWIRDERDGWTKGGSDREIEKTSKTLELINALNEIYLFTRRFLGYEYIISRSFVRFLALYECMLKTMMMKKRLREMGYSCLHCYSRIFEFTFCLVGHLGFFFEKKKSCYFVRCLFESEK